MNNNANNSKPVVIIKIILSIIVGAIFYIQIKEAFFTNSTTVGFGIAFLIFTTVELTEFILRTLQEAEDLPKEYKIFGNKFMNVFNLIYHIVTIILGIVVIFTAINLIIVDMNMYELLLVGFIILIKGFISLIIYLIKINKKTP